MKPHEIRFEGGKGDRAETAVVVRGAQSEVEGTYAAYAWLVQKYGPKDEAWKLVSHSHGVFAGREISTFVIRLADGDTCSVFFDCTESFGRF